MSRQWLHADPHYSKRVERQHLLPLGSVDPELTDGCHVTLKYRHPNGSERLDPDASLVQLKEQWFLKSVVLSDDLAEFLTDKEWLILWLEGSDIVARCTLVAVQDSFFEDIEVIDPTLRVGAYDLPPHDSTLVDTQRLTDIVYDWIVGDDPELFAVHTDRFLDAPHILTPLFAHVLSLSSEKNMRFPIVLKQIADQFRQLLTDGSCTQLTIRRLSRDHQRVWAAAMGEKVAFVDGGVARIAGLPGSEPLALRVGVYRVTPGEESLHTREDWRLWPYVVGDMVSDPPGGRKDGEDTDRKRLLEATRYVVEPLSALRYMRDEPDLSWLFLHGPLVNQFQMYDEGEPNFIPCLSEKFLASCGIREEDISAVLTDIPKAANGDPLWNQFMSVYGLVLSRIFTSKTPIVGVVERTAGTWVTNAVLEALVDEAAITVKYASRLRAELRAYEVSDDFLFGCVLKEGEYLPPVQIPKNIIRRTREHWQPVVRQYPRPYASILKTNDTTFPFRLEMNQAAANSLDRLADLLYHIARLLPRYAFPVGLDIVDKYAKIPDWLSRGVSTRLSAEVLKRALATGDSLVVTQIRQFLAHTPRDFFYRPNH